MVSPPAPPLLKSGCMPPPLAPLDIFSPSCCRFSFSWPCTIFDTGVPPRVLADASFWRMCVCVIFVCVDVCVCHVCTFVCLNLCVSWCLYLCVFGVCLCFCVRVARVKRRENHFLHAHALENHIPYHIRNVEQQNKYKYKHRDCSRLCPRLLLCLCRLADIS